MTSQHAREAAARLSTEIGFSKEQEEAILSGTKDYTPFVVAFAQFEAETLERVASLIDDYESLANDGIEKVFEDFAAERIAKRIRQLKGQS